MDYRILAFNTGHLKGVLPTKEEYDMLNKYKKKYYYKLCSRENPGLYYNPEDHKSKCRLPKYYTCGVNGCTKRIKGLSNLKRHRDKCETDAGV